MKRQQQQQQYLHVVLVAASILHACNYCFYLRQLWRFIIIIISIVVVVRCCRWRRQCRENIAADHHLYEYLHIFSQLLLFLWVLCCFYNDVKCT